MEMNFYGDSWYHLAAIDKIYFIPKFATDNGLLHYEACEFPFGPNTNEKREKNIVINFQAAGQTLDEYF